MTSRVVRLATAVAIILVAGAALRFAGLDREPLWVDEAISARFSEAGAGRLLALTARDVHPPLYYLLLHTWRGAFGGSVFALRAMSVLWSLSGLVALALLARRSTSGSAALIPIVVALAAVHPLDVFFAQTARMYSQLAALATAASVVLWFWMDASVRERGCRRWLRWAALYAAIAAAMLFTHYLGAVLLVAQGVFALGFFGLRRRWSCAGAYVGCAAACAAAYLPWMGYVRSFRGTLYSSNHLIWIPRPAVEDIPGMLVDELVRGTVPLGRPWTTLVAVLSSCLVAGAAILLVRRWVRIRSGRDRASLDAPPDGLAYLTWLVAAPVVLAFAISLMYHPVLYPPRFAVLVLPPFLVLLGTALSEVAAGRWRWTWIAVTLAFFVSLTAVQTTTISNARVDHLAELWRQAPPPAKVAFFPRYNDRLVSYYLGQRVRSASRNQIEELLAEGSPVTIWICSQNGGPPLNQSQRSYRSWLLSLGRSQPVIDTQDFEVLRIDLE